MNRLLPRSLFAQTVLILLAGLIVSQAIGWWLHTSDREQAVRAIGGLAAAQRIANLIHLVEDAPLEWRGRLVSALSDHSLKVSLANEPPAFIDRPERSTAAQVIREFLSQQLSVASGQDLIVSVSAPGGYRPFGRHTMGHGPMMHGPHGFGMFRDLQVAAPLTGGQWIHFATAVPETGPGFTRQFMLSLALMAIIVLAVSLWAVRRVTAPLASLSVAAERLGNDLDAPPILETGSTETRQASRAFNVMQARLRGMVDNRTRMLAAISHDLRTPLTLLRLRAETVADAVERDRMLATIAEMDAMVGAALQFARDEHQAEARRPTAIAALVQSVVDDLADAGLPVTMQPAPPVVLDCRSDALRRAIRNLLDNAIKYGGAARASLEATRQSVAIVIEDKGPGIPEKELDQVFQPFYRLDPSRSAETSGIGLGLAIALSIVQAHGGRLTLANRESGGLRATITLPR